jgi:hypothetical protein
LNAAVRFVKPMPELVFNTSLDKVVQFCLRIRARMEKIKMLTLEI